MQYPIIDLITSAYINNGWTGLDISTGKNLFDESTADRYHYYISSGGVWTYSEDSYSYIFLCERNNTYTISMSNSYVTLFNVGTTNSLPILTEPIVLTEFYRPASNPITITPSVDYIIIQCNRLFVESRDCLIQIEEGTQATPYEPYSLPKNDFPNRLKLPLPHYFPHPVIVALQRAAAGTQTADDTEILQHYLTPLGIGGI